MKDPAEAEVVGRVVDEVTAAKKYRHVLRELVRRCAEHELRRGAPPAEAVKRTKRKLHQIYAAYMPQSPRYGSLLRELAEAVRDGDDASIREVARRSMQQHASTRERLPGLEQVYDALAPELETARSVLDLACALNPLAFPWMHLPANARYWAFDLDHELVGFVDQALTILNVEHECKTVDLLSDAPLPTVDVAFAFKLLPCLEQQAKGASRALLRRLRARTCVVSFPLRSLGGREKGMHQSYAQSFEALLAEQDWPHRRFETPNELFYVVTVQR